MFIMFITIFVVTEALVDSHAPLRRITYTPTPLSEAPYKIANKYHKKKIEPEQDRPKRKYHHSRRLVECVLLLFLFESHVLAKLPSWQSTCLR